MNPVTGMEEVFCPVTSFFDVNGDRRILRIINGTQVDSLPWINRLLGGLWTNAGYPLYACGDGLFENRSCQWREIPTGVYTNDIRGAGLNNIVAVGDFGYIVHFDGNEWQNVGYDFNAGYSSVAVSENFIIAVGNKNGRALVTIGRRN
jgi:hypothetical protein